MKYQACLLILFISFHAVLSSQSCLPKGIRFTTQGQIDSFQVNYPGCNLIEGDLYIGIYTGASDITNLNGLMVLDSLGGRLIIEYNDFLTSIEGLSNITSVGGQVGIWLNSSLTSLTGLEGLTIIKSNLGVGRDDLLTDLSGLDNLTTVEGSLEISGNDALVSLSGLEGVTTIGGSLRINDNNVLPDLTGLDNLMMTGSGIEIEFNDSLTSLNGLEELISIGDGAIRLKANYALANIAGLENIDAGSIGGLSVGWNTALSQCDIYSICEYLAIPGGEVVIRYNAPGCNTPAEVEAACSVGMGESAFGSWQSAVVCYPNPAHDQVVFDFNLQTQSEVNLSVFNNLGQKLATIHNGTLEKGDHRLKWNAAGFPAGIYFYRFSNPATRNPEMGKLLISR